MSILRILMVQPRLCWQDAAENRRQLEMQIDEALGGGRGENVGLIVVPETFTTGFLGDHDRRAESMDGETVQWMRELATRYGAAMTGSVVIEEQGLRFNRMLVVTREGVLGYYDKRHLFGYGGEDQRYAAGNRRVIIAHEGWRICLQICYDLRFPVWCRNRDDYDLLLFVANWPGRRVAAWNTLLRARAMENQAYVIGINRVGRDGNDLEYPGQSAAYDPLGEPLVELGKEVAARIVELDLEALRRVRAALPFLADADSFHLELGQG